MATPMSAAPTGGAPADPTQGADPSQGQAPDLSNGYEITIKVDANQQITVSVDPASPDDDSGSGGGSDDGSGDDESSQAVPSIKAACQVVMDIFKNAGQMTDGGAEQDAMAGGYGVPQGAGGGQ